MAGVAAEVGHMAETSFTEVSRTAVDLSIISAAVVVSVLVIITVVVSSIVRRLQCLVGGDNKAESPHECAGWLKRRAKTAP